MTAMDRINGKTVNRKLENTGKTDQLTEGFENALAHLAVVCKVPRQSRESTLFACGIILPPQAPSELKHWRTADKVFFFPLKNAYKSE